MTAAKKQLSNKSTSKNKPQRVVCSPPKPGEITQAMARKAIIEIAKQRGKGK